MEYKKYSKTPEATIEIHDSPENKDEGKELILF